MSNLIYAGEKREWVTFWIFYTLSVLFAFAILPFAMTDLFRSSATALYSTDIQPDTSIVTGIRIVLQDAAGLPAMLFLVLGPFTPTLAAYVTAAARIGWRGVLEIVDRYKPWRRGVTAGEGLRLWAIALLVQAGIIAFGSLIRLYIVPALGGPEYQWSAPDMVWYVVIGSILVGMFTDAGGLMEETGWRGFAQPLLQRVANPTVACLIVGALWGLWHIPVKFDTISSAWEAPGYFALFYGFYIIGGAAGAVFYGYFVNRLGGSALIAIALHGVGNNHAGLGAGLVDAGQIYNDHMLVPMLFHFVTMVIPGLIVATVLIIMTKGQLGFREGSRLEALDKVPARDDRSVAAA